MPNVPSKSLELQSGDAVLSQLWGVCIVSEVIPGKDGDTYILASDNVSEERIQHHIATELAIIAKISFSERLERYGKALR